MIKISLIYKDQIPPFGRTKINNCIFFENYDSEIFWNIFSFCYHTASKHFKTHHIYTYNFTRIYEDLYSFSIISRIRRILHQMSTKDFQILSKLGQGVYSSVYIVRRLLDNQQYALKIVKMNNLSDKQKQNSLTQVRILASMKTHYIIAYKEAFIEKDSLYIVMEYMNNGDLFQKIEQHRKNSTTFTETQIWSIFTQVVQGLRCLHHTKIMHRDLKSANVFMNKTGDVKLGDLNVSKILKKGLCQTQTGTPYYASPQVWCDEPYDYKSDIWSLGCVLYEVTTLRPPFRAEDMQGLYKKVMKGSYPKISSKYSEDLSFMIKQLLQLSPHSRPTCDDIVNMPSFKFNSRLVQHTSKQSIHSNLLKTIRIPKNSRLSPMSIFPSATYSTVSPSKSNSLHVRNFFLPLINNKQNASKQKRKVQDYDPRRQKQNCKSLIVSKSDQLQMHLPKMKAQKKKTKVKELKKIYMQ